jgi:hypothetical protein
MKTSTDEIMSANGYTALDKNTPIEEMDIVEYKAQTRGTSRKAFYYMQTFNTGDANEHIRSNDSYVLGGCVRYYPRSTGVIVTGKITARSFHKSGVTQIWRRDY